MKRLSLMEALATVPDLRSPLGLRHPWEAVLSVTVVAVLAGMKSLEAVARFERDHGPPLAHALGFRRGKTPAKATLRKLFRRLDIDASKPRRATCSGTPGAIGALQTGCITSGRKPSGRIAHY
jgi:hypothetical protein